MVKQVIISEENSGYSNHSLLGRVISINHLSNDVIDKIESRDEFDSMFDELSKSPIEYFAYM